MIDKGICEKGFILYLSNCECECNKSWDIGEYLDYKNFKFRKWLVDKLVKECNENFDEKELHPAKFNSNKMICNLTINNYEKLWALFWIGFLFISTSNAEMKS